MGTRLSSGRYERPTRLQSIPIVNTESTVYTEQELFQLQFLCNAPAAGLSAARVLVMYVSAVPTPHSATVEAR